MKPHLSLLSLLLSLGTLAPALALERTVQKSFPVGPDATLKLDTYRGSISVEDSDEPQIRVDVRLELATDDETEADRNIKNLELEQTSAGDTVTVRARNPSDSRARFSWSDKRRVDLSFRIRVPRACNLELATLDGGITVGNVAGRVVAHARAGTIFCRQIDGSVQASLDSGEIVVSRCTGAVDLSVLRGTIRVGTIFGPAILRNTSGDIEIQSARGGLKASAAAGDVQAGFSKNFQGAASIEADGGSIYVKLDPAARCEVQATSVWGHVLSALPLEIASGANGKRQLAGRLNGGGPLLTLHASGGHVKLEPSTQFIE